MGSALININQISPNPNNPRKNFDEAALEELAASIREHGIIQPLVVKYTDTDEGGSLQFQLICGERRLRAARMLRMEKVPVVYRVADDDELSPAAEALKMLVENLQREDLDPIEEATAFHWVLGEFDMTQEELADQLGVSQGHIANRIRLLDLPETVQENISRGIISASHGKVLAGHKNLPATVIEKAVEVIVSDNVPVAKADTTVLRLVANAGLPLFDNHRKKPEFKSGKGSECYTCEHRAMGKDMYITSGNEQPFCLNPECWERKQEEALKTAEEQNLVDISKLSYNQYEYWSKESGSYDQSECRDCEYRKKAKGRGDQYYCLDPACMKKKKTAKTKADNKQKNNTFQAELGQITEMVAGRIDHTVSVVECDCEVTVKIDKTALIYIAAQVIANVDTWHDRKVNRYQYLKNKLGWDNDLLKSGAYNLLQHDWDTFRRFLENLDELQLLEVVMEWPAVARGLKGAEGWFLQQVPQSSEPMKKLPVESEFEVVSVVTGRVKRCKDCAKINEDRICSAFGFERVSLTSPQHCQHYKLRGDVDIESIPKSVEEANREKESGPDPVHALIGRCIKTHYDTGGVVANVAGPLDGGFYSITYKSPHDGEDCWINSITFKDGVILCEGIPLTIPEMDESKPEPLELPARQYLDNKGRVLFVNCGTSDGEDCFTCYKNPNTPGTHRLKSQLLPLRKTREEAQFDLDMWAKEKGLQPVEDGEHQCKSA